MLVSRQVIRFSLLLGDTMGVRGAVVQFGGCLVVLVMRSVVITSGHIKYSLSAPTCCGRRCQLVLLGRSAVCVVCFVHGVFLGKRSQLLSARVVPLSVRSNGVLAIHDRPYMVR